MYPTRPRAMAALEAAYRLHRLDLAEDKAAFLATYGPRCRAVVTNGHAGLSSAELAHLPEVGLVACSSAGFETIDVSALRARGIALTNSSVALADDVADMALLLMLAARRRLIAADQHVRTGAWAREGMYPLLRTTRGARVGLVGFGTIGAAIAARLGPFGVSIGYTARSRRAVDFRYHDSLLALAGWAAILIATLPGGAETRGLIGREVLGALGPDGTLVNVGRGSVVDEPALIEALTTGTLGHAALDVYASEPAPDPLLTRLPNVTLSPHHASGTVETRDAMAQTVVDNLAAFFAGRPLPTPV